MLENFTALQDEVKLLLNFTSGAVDQNFTAQQIKDAVNRAYTREVREAKLEGSHLWFKVYQDFTWPADTTTMELPSGLDSSMILRFYDSSDSDPGIQLEVGDQGNLGVIFWRDYKTLQWNASDGPGQDKTITVVYIGDAQEMISEGDVPFLVPPENRELIKWSAAIDLRLHSDEAAPMSWLQKHRDCQLDFQKKVSLGRPMDAPPLVRITRKQDNTFVYYS